MTAAVGTAAGAGLWLLALVVTAGHFVVVFGLTAISTRLPRSRYAASRLRLTYVDGQGVLRRVLAEITRRDFSVAELAVDQQEAREAHEESARAVGLWLTITGRGRISDLTASLAEVRGVLTINADDGNAPAG